MGTNASPLVLTAGTPLFTLYSTCAGESGSTNAEPMYVKSVLTGAGQVGGRSYFLVTSDVASGSYINAIKGDIEFGSSGSSSGLASAICAEMTLPNQTVPSGQYYPLEIEWIGGASTNVAGTTGSGTGCIYINATGTTTKFDDYAGLFWLNGVSAGAGHIYSADGRTIKCYVTSSMTSKYIVLSSAENALTMTGGTITAGTITDGAFSTTSGAVTGVTNFTMSGFFDLGSQGSGVALVTGNEFAMEVHAKPTTALTAGDTGLSAGIRCRYEVGATQTNQISIVAVDARLRPKYAMADGAHAGINAGIEADAVAFGGTATTQRSAGHFYIEMADGASVTTGWLTGITIDSSVHDNVSMANCTFAGLRIKKSSGKEVWEYGIYMGDSDVVTGINIGTCTTAINLDGTITTGIVMEPSAMTNGIIIGTPNTSHGYGLRPNMTDSWSVGAPIGFYFDDGNTAITAWGECFTVGFVITADSTGGSQTGWPYTAFFYKDIRADITSAATQHWATVMMNTAIASGKTIDGFDNHGLSTLHLSVDVNGTLASGQTISNLSFGGNSTGTIDGTWVCMHVRDTTGDFDAFMEIDANATGCYTEANSGDGGFVSNSKGTFTQTGQLRIIVNGNTVYVPYGTVG